jgi:hypothetical protein
MKTILSAITLVLVGVASSGAEEFTLTDRQTGEAYGPFPYSNEVKVLVRGREYELKRKYTALERYKAKLKSIIVPSIEFRNANIMDVVSFLMEASIVGDPEGVGTSLILSRTIETNRSNNATQTRDFDSPFFPEQPPQLKPIGNPITLNLRRVSLYDAITIIAEAAGLEYKFDERGVVFLNPKGEVLGRTTNIDQQER